MNKTTSKIKPVWLLTAAFIILLIGIIIIANVGLGSTAFTFLKYIPGGDKTGHFFLIGMLSFLVNLSMGAKTTTWKSMSVLKGSLIVFLVVVTEEFSQIFLKYRGFDLVDLLADAAGILVFGRLAKGLVHRNRPKEKNAE